MKKVILTLAIVLGTITLTQAQDNAIGLRLGYGAEISYQKALGSNRLELDLGLRMNKNSHDFFLTGVYQWVSDLSVLADGFNWYLGLGGSLLYWNGENWTGDNFDVGVVGQIGIEYNFSKFPLQLSLDYRPAIYFLNGVNGWYNTCFGLGIRYKF